MIIVLKKKILVAPLKSKETTTNGFIIPDSSEQRRGQGVVIAIGDDCGLNEVRIGYIVLYKEWSGIKVTHDLETYIILDPDDIVAVLTDAIEDLGMTNEEQSQKFFKEILQPFRYGKFSKEFVESYPKQTKRMLDSGGVTQEEINSAIYLYENVPGWKEWKKNLKK